jgi:hypothetical protein
MVVVDPEPIPPRVHILVNSDLVADDIDVSLDLGFLQDS